MTTSIQELKEHDALAMLVIGASFQEACDFSGVSLKRLLELWRTRKPAWH